MTTMSERVYALASAIIAASPAVTVGQAIMLAVKIIKLLDSVPTEAETDDETNRSA